MHFLQNKHILLGISGSIAAYKSAELVRQLRTHGAIVRVVMTTTACQFITTSTLCALSGERVYTDQQAGDSQDTIRHIELARWADMIMIAPASANFIARLGVGMADNLLLTLCLAASCPLYLAPAMNQQMWRHPATQRNITTLRQRGAITLGPASGEQACGEYGPGRMLEPDEILACLRDAWAIEGLDKASLLLTAGPTREPIDPVRFISNRSSGRMGYAIAQAAVQAGAEVTLITGPSVLPVPAHVKVIKVTTARAMHAAVMENIKGSDLFIAAAAVSDYYCATIADQKIKKDHSASLKLSLAKTTDILAEVAGLDQDRPFTVGFAAETTDLKKAALEKLDCKKPDMIVANQVGWDQGFECEESALHVFWPGGEQILGWADKSKLARQLIKLIGKHYHAYAKNRIGY